MHKRLTLLKSLLVPAAVIAVAALLTIPWAVWVVRGAYEREIGERAHLIEQRIRLQMAAARNWADSRQILDSLEAELMSDRTVQAVGILDELDPGRNQFLTRRDDVRVPSSIAEAESMLVGDSNSYRSRLIQKTGEYRRVIYVDLSRTELNRHFWRTYRPLLRNVIASTTIGFAIISVAGILAYRLWGRASRQQERAELEQQGLLAERVLTAAVMAHEIRNPLAALRFQLHSLRRNAGDSARVAATADTIDNELMRIQQLVQNYLAHEKAQGMHARDVDLCAAGSSVRELMEELLRAAGTRMTIEEPAERVVVCCDPHGLRQVLINLIINAQEAMGRGGQLMIEIGREKEYGVIAVRDTGPGIPPEMRERLFKPFATSKKDGSGIGLALVRRFADNFGGAVSVDSEPGRGATFRLRLPLAQQPPSPADDPTRIAPADGVRRTQDLIS